MFRVGNSTFYIPSQLNKHTHIGDHTIECMAKPQFINSGTDLAKNAKLVNYASKVFINEALSSKPVDVREMFSTVSSKVSSLPAGPEKEC